MNLYLLAFSLKDIWQKIDSWFADKLQFDKWLDFVVDYIKTMPELLKWGLGIFTAIIIVLGVISFIKKMFKVFVILAIIALIIVLIWKT